MLTFIGFLNFSHSGFIDDLFTKQIKNWTLLHPGCVPCFPRHKVNLFYVHFFFPFKPIGVTTYKTRASQTRKTQRSKQYKKTLRKKFPEFWDFSRNNFTAKYICSKCEKLCSIIISIMTAWFSQFFRPRIWQQKILLFQRRDISWQLMAFFWP